MQLAPDDLIEKLEFDKIQQLLKNYCLGNLGIEKVGSLPINKDASTIQRLLDESREYKYLMDNSHRFPIARYEDLSEVWRMLRVEGYVLPEEALQQIAAQMRIVRDFFRFFKSKVEWKEELPNLFNVLSTISFDELLLEEIDRVVDEEGEIKSNASPDLMRIRRLTSSKRKECDQRFRGLINRYKSQGLLKDIEESFRNGRRVLAVPAEHKRKIRGIIHDESATGKTSYIEPEEIIEINNDIFDLLNEEKREIYRILKALSDLLRPYLELLKEYEATITRFDVIQAKAQLAGRFDGYTPKVKENPTFKLVKAYHPLLLLKNQSEGKPTVPFEFEFYNKNRILLLSGPNAGGKSICMKAVGLMQLMFQAGLPIPVGEGSELGIFNKIFADIGDQQSLEDELSTYSSRLKNAKLFIDEADDKTLVLIDEFGSGTDPKVGGAIAEAILDALNKKKVYGVVTTHYSNLKLFAFKNRGIINGAMIFDKDTLSPTYEMMVGKPGSSYAFEIAQKSGLPNKIIGYAKRKIGKHEKSFDELLVELQREKQEAEEVRLKMEDHQKKLDILIKNYQQLSSDLEHKRKRLKLQVKEQAMVEAQATNKELQKLIREIREEENKSKAIKKAKRLSDEVSKEKKELDATVYDLKEGIYEDFAKTDNATIAVGSHVKLRGGGASGVVETISKKEAVVLMGNLKLNVPLRDLTLVKNPLEKPQSAMVTTKTTGNVSNFQSKLDIRGMRHTDALNTLEVFIDKALVANASELWIIHGKGTGVLRNAVRQKLREYRDVSNVRHAEGNAGGDGVTIAELI